MTYSLMDAIKTFLPLEIERAEWSDPVLSLGGKDWSFNSTSTWRIVDEIKFLFGSEDEDASGAVLDLIGVTIVACEFASQNPELDPRFILSNGTKFEVFSATAFEPWVLRLPEGPIFVASPSS